MTLASRLFCLRVSSAVVAAGAGLMTEDMALLRPVKSPGTARKL
jgi:hypothetical protein